MTTALRASRVTRFVVIPLTLVALLSSCYKWSTASQSPADFIREEEPSKVRLTLTEDRQVVVENPVVTDGAISGVVGGHRERSDSRWTWVSGDSLGVIPLDDVVQLQERRFNGFLSVTLPVFLAGLFVLAAVTFPENVAGT